MGHWIFTEEHELFRKSVRKFVEKEIVPHVEEWERAEAIPRSLFRRAGELGYLGISLPEEYGGSGGDLIAEAVLIEEIAKGGAGGVVAALGIHAGLALRAVWRFGSEGQKRKYLPPGIFGDAIAAMAVTEPDAGSDVSSIVTRAVRDGDEWVINGSKMFVTNGASADWVVVAAKTDPEAGRRGISLFIVETDRPGFSVGRKLDKLGWRSSDTAELFFNEVRIPAENLIGVENRGFYHLMEIFRWERIIVALASVGLAEKALEDAMRYSAERIQFGRPIRAFQVLRHKMVDMALDIEKARSLAYWALYLHHQGKDCLRETAMAKAYAGEMVRRVTDAALQIHGGNGYMMEFPVQRYWRDARLMSIGGGTTQIMHEILVKATGISEGEIG